MAKHVRSISCAVAFLLFFVTGLSDAEAETVVLTEDTWRNLLEGEWMVAFMAPWCPACQTMHDTWRRFADGVADLNVQVGEVDITENPALTGRFMVTALPTIYHVKDGVFRQYQSGRDYSSLMSFVEKRKWSVLTPLSPWKYPDSVHMSIVARFFRWSYQIRAVHTYLVEQRGLPYWASYGLITLATIIVGTVLGLLIIACIDCAFPPKALLERSAAVAAAGGSHKRPLGRDAGVACAGTEPRRDGSVSDLADDTDQEDSANQNTESPKGPRLRKSLVRSTQKDHDDNDEDDDVEHGDNNRNDAGGDDDDDGGRHKDAGRNVSSAKSKKTD